MKIKPGVSVEAFEDASDGMLVLDENHTIISVNAAFCRLLGCDARGLLGRKAEAVFPREAAFRNDTAIQRLREDERLLGGCQLKRRDGMLLSVEVSIRGLPDGRLLGIVRDISERTKALKSLRESEDRELEVRMAEAQRLQCIGQFASGIAHDFNNILQAVAISSGALALHGDDPEKRTSALHEIDACTRRGATLVRQLLTFARGGRTDFELIDLNEVVCATEDLLRRLVPSHVELLVEFGAGPIPVRANRGQIGQVLMNLVVNACDALPSGGTVTVSMGVAATGAWFQVCDTGPGISPQDRDRIFDPFFTTKEPEKGSGLGLAIVGGIVARHGGSVEVTTKPGGGAAFLVVLPRDAAVVCELHDSSEPESETI